MKNNYIKKTPPKSTDIDEFGYMIINKIKDEYGNISSFDIIRTLVQFTIDSIKLNIDNFIKTNSFRLVYSGGGTEHPIVLDWLNSMPYVTESISKYGIDSSIKESLLMASLGIAKINNIPSNMPSVTGAINNIVLGDIYEG